MGLRFQNYVGAIEKILLFRVILLKSLMLAFLAHSLLAMLVTPENLNPVRRGRGGKKKFTPSHVKCHIYCFVFTDSHIPYFQPHGNQTQLILANHESNFFFNYR